MPTLFPNAIDILSGVGGDGRIRINGITPPALESIYAGGWAVSDSAFVEGNGTDNGDDWSLWSYGLVRQSLTKVDPRGATNTYGGGGVWSTFLAASPPVSYDSLGHNWDSLVTRGVSPSGTILYSSLTNDALIKLRLDGTTKPIASGLVQTCDIGLNDVVLWASPDGALHADGMFAPQAPLGGGIGAKFATGQNNRSWLCQWDDQLKQLVVYPWRYPDGTPLIGYALSGDEHDFNHDIGVQSNGRISVCTGVDAAESATRFYELDTAAGTFRVNGGDWQWLVSVRLDQPPAPVYPPITPIKRALWFTFYAFGSTNAPRNCELRVGADMALRSSDGRLIAWYVSGSPDGDVDALDAAIAAMRAKHPGEPIFAYWTAAAQKIRLPKGADLLGVEAYQAWNEPTAVFEARVRSAVQRANRPWIVAQCYTSNAALTSDLRGIPPVISRIAADQRYVEGIACFSAGKGRATGYEDHPEVQADWQAVFASITGPGVVPEPPTPIPPTPTPIPPPTHDFSEVIQMADYPGVYGIKFGGFYGRIDPADTADQPRIWFDQTSITDDGKVEVTKPDDRYQVRFVKSGKLVCFLGAPDAPIGSYVRCFETRPDGARGPSESPDVVKYKSDGMICASVRYLTPGTSDKWYFSCNLTLDPA